MSENDKFAQIVGNSNVFDEPEILEVHSRDESFVPVIEPRLVVKPGDASEVLAVVKLANDTLTPLVPVSSGPPHFRGCTVPSTGGAVIVDLSRMKKIVRIDSRNRVAMVEPGVTFSELQPELKKEGLRLNMPLLPRMSKSVIASVLEREPVIMPNYQWDIADPLLCTEVIFGTGDIFRTGSAAGPGTLEEQWKSGAAQKAGAGPSQADLYRVIQGAQGTMGIVTWATIQCERLPVLEELFLAGSSRLDSILHLTYWLNRLRLADECIVLNNSNLAAILSKEGSTEYESLRHTLPPWILFFCIAGYRYLPEEKVAYQVEDIRNIAKRAGLQPAGAIGDVSAREVLRLLRSPSEEPYWKLRGKGSCHDIFFLTTEDKLSELIQVMYDAAERYGYPVPDIGVYIQPIAQGTGYHCEFNLFFDPKNSGESDIVRDLSTDASNTLMAKGAFFSRPYGPWADMAYRRDAETTGALRKVKGIFDPNNIMNPGKLCF